MDYQTAKRTADELYARVDVTGKTLNQFERGPMGLTTDAAKATPEWKTAKREYEHAFQKLRTFNDWYCRQFKAERAADRLTRYASQPKPAE